MTVDQLRSRWATGDHTSFPVATDHDIRHTESALGLPLPASYKSFLREFSNGARLYPLQEIFGVGSRSAGGRLVQSLYPMVGDSPNPFFPPNHWMVQCDDGSCFDARFLVPFSHDGNGCFWCFVANHSTAEGEYEVACFDVKDEMLHKRLHGFWEWLMTALENDEVSVQARQ